MLYYFPNLSGETLLILNKSKIQKILLQGPSGDTSYVFPRWIYEGGGGMGGGGGGIKLLSSFLDYMRSEK